MGKACHGRRAREGHVRRRLFLRGRHRDSTQPTRVRLLPNRSLRPEMADHPRKTANSRKQNVQSNRDVQKGRRSRRQEGCPASTWEPRWANCTRFHCTARQLRRRWRGYVAPKRQGMRHHVEHVLLFVYPGGRGGVESGRWPGEHVHMFKRWLESR